MSRRGTVIKATSVVAVLGLLTTVAVISQGFDVAQTPVNDSAVWALQGDGNRYARINTELHEIDTVKDVKNPSELVQSESTALVLMEGYGRIGGVDPGRPQNFSDETEGLGETPTGTAKVSVSSDFVGYLTDNGRIFVARIDDGAEASAVAIDPYAEQNAQPDAEQRLYSADSIAISPSGVLYAFAISESAVLRYDLVTGQLLGQDDVDTPPSAGGTRITVVDSTWVLLSADGSTLWIDGAAPVETGLADDATLQRPSGSSDSVLISTRSGLSAFALGDGSASALVDGGVLGIPARAVELNGVMFAAWLDENGTSGLMWSSVNGEQVLDYAGKTLDAEPIPVLRSNGSSLILNDSQSGWVWTLPDGELVPSSQDWGLAADATQDTTDNEEQASIVSERKPPVGVADQFGVRAGQLVNLPVLLNDHDPNEDVLTIDPASIAGPDASFGSVAPTNNSQDLVIAVAATASGTATFTYRATDGTQTGGLLSEPTTVTLTVFGDDVNSAPVWCGVLECQREWPKLQVQPGSSASAEVLRGWVDPEGDPIYVASATTLGEVGSVASTPDGTVLFQHPDASLPGGSASVSVRISDIRGAFTDKELSVDITATPSLKLEPFAVTASVGEPLSIDPGKYISGVTGSFTVSAAKTEIEEQASISIDNGAKSFTMTAPAAGDYFLSYTVADEATELIGVVRVTAVDSGSTQLSSSPITVFVRPKADSTIDVFPAVTNPSNKVLLLTEALPRPLGGSSLDVEVVNQQLLRVKGSTADGQPGPLGTVAYTVTDGTGNGLSTARGEATVILLPAAAAQSPVAVPDAITVRAGTQIDIPVLANDLAPDGNSLILNPDSIQFESADGLAFASGNDVRFLAPSASGDYEIGYTVYTAGSPEISGKSTVSVTVTPSGENRAPQPHTLIGRVLAGSSVSIPFDSFGLDPDGDAVILDTIVSQPDSGSASIAVTGDAIIYTSVPGSSGPVSFDYRVKDQFGETGTATVRVGVLDQESDPSPVTYSDYVEVQLGAKNRVTVQPAANDLDPANRELTVTGVVPDAPVGSAEYDELAALVSLGDDGTVTLTAGEILGTKSYFYTVANSTGDTNAGLIVMKVVRESVPDHPKVVDTYLTVEDRAAFASGIDVVSGKVTWNSGEVTDLRLSLWGNSNAYAAQGWKISGALPLNTVVIPFQLSGTNSNGDEVSTFGFLRVPGKNDIILALRAGTTAQEVDESKSTTFDLADLVTVPAGEKLSIDNQKVGTGGKRTHASCSVTSGTELRYDAGADRPWTDYCAVPVKLAGQDDYTIVIVPISVIPEIPLPILHSAAITQSPAAEAVSYDLLKMVDWAGKADNASLVFQTAYSGDQFSVVQSGNSVTVYALDNANPGRENTVKVSLSSHPEVSATVLSLKVGPAPTELPKGGTVAKECSQAGNTTSCLVTAIGIPGEVNVFRTSLTLVSVSVPASCTGVSMDVADSTHIRATWTGDAPGGKCTASFVVKDPQGRVSPDDRSGSFLLDLKGYPKAPSALTQSGYGDKTIKFSVNPGPASAAYPALTGFSIMKGSTEVATCTALGVCTTLTVASNGDKQTYDAVAVNDVGQSKTKASVTAWAYRPPTLPVLASETLFHATTTVTKGRVKLTITDADATIDSFTVASGAYNSVVSRDGSGITVSEFLLNVGSASIAVTPISVVDVPSGVGATPAAVTTSLNVAGTPQITNVGLVSALGSNELEVTGEGFNANFGAIGPGDVRYIAYRGAQPTCSPDGSGGLTVSPPANGVDSSNPQILGLDSNVEYQVKLCITNGFGIAEATVGSAIPFEAPNPPVGWKYAIAGDGNGSFLVSAITDVAADTPADFTALTAASGYGISTDVTVKYCLTIDLALCGPAATVAPVDLTRTYQVSLISLTLSTCTFVPGVLEPVVAVAGASETVSTIISGYTYVDAIGDSHVVVGNVVAVDAIAITKITVDIMWRANGGAGTYATQQTRTLASHVTCTP